MNKIIHFQNENMNNYHNEDKKMYPKKHIHTQTSEYF